MTRFRTLVRVDWVGPASIMVQLPGWHAADAPMIVGRSALPDEVNARLEASDFTDAPYLHARVNLAAELPCELRFSDWEAS